MVMWLPTYCSDLNPIERFWRHFKDLACANKLQSGTPLLKSKDRPWAGFAIGSPVTWAVSSSDHQRITGSSPPLEKNFI
jgi:hypothetical protein